MKVPGMLGQYLFRKTKETMMSEILKSLHLCRRRQKDDPSQIRVIHEFNSFLNFDPQRLSSLVVNYTENYGGSSVTEFSVGGQCSSIWFCEDDFDEEDFINPEPPFPSEQFVSLIPEQSPFFNYDDEIEIIPCPQCGGAGIVPLYGGACDVCNQTGVCCPSEALDTMTVVLEREALRCS
jgi:hypothetical protein